MLITRRNSVKLLATFPFFGMPSVSDPNTLLEYIPAGATDNLNAGYSAGLSGKTQRDGSLVASQKTLVLVIFGQSNTCNVNPSAYVASNASVIDNFNIYNGGTYAATTPLIGCSCSTLGPGNPFLRLADKLITSGTFDRVILVPAGIGATTAAMWAADSYNRIAVTGRRLAAARLLGSTATVAVAYQQGETDAGATSQVAYTSSLNTFITNVRLWHSGPIFIAQSSWNGTISDTNITNAQASVVTNTANGIWSLGNMDANTTTWRQGAGNTHLSDTGADAWATAMQTALHAYGSPF
jgi:hypothetical protein